MDKRRPCVGRPRPKKRCNLYKKATQTVFGEGDALANIIRVGEPPGDKSAIAGRHVTNAGKRFKFKQRGKRRIHSSPMLARFSALRGGSAANLNYCSSSHCSTRCHSPSPCATRAWPCRASPTSISTAVFGAGRKEGFGRLVGVRGLITGGDRKSDTANLSTPTYLGKEPPCDWNTCRFISPISEIPASKKH